jgi:hypothetical protein
MVMESGAARIRGLRGSGSPGSLSTGDLGGGIEEVSGYFSFQGYPLT